MAKMTDDELLSHVEKEEANCIVHFSSLLSEQRRKALAYYYGQPYGNEVEGRSQVVTTEVKDAVEGIMPSLMAIFTSADEIVRFEAQNPDDEEAAQQATDYLNYKFSRLNNGFLALYCLFKDALLLKNGYVKVYWDDYQHQEKETYENLDDSQFAGLLDEEQELELLEHTEKPDEEEIEKRAKQVEQMQAQLAQAHAQLQQMPPQQAMQAQGQLQAMAMQIQQIMSLPEPKLHDAVFKRTHRHKGVCIEPTPPEEILVSRETTNELKNARFVEHRTLRTLSEIREMGFDVSDNIADYAPNADFNLERVERLKFDDALAYRQDSDTNDPSTKRVWLCEAYVKVDYDGDGIAELRKVTKVGHTLLDNEEFDSLPIIGGTAIPMPHKHYGLSIFDLIGDIQLIKSTITRQLLDNAYNANNSRTVVLDGMVNMQDLLTSRPGGVIRAKALGAVQQLNHTLLGQPFYNLLDYFDKVKQNRIGATDFPNAVDPDAINAKATFVDAFKNAAMERVALMARIFAEGPVKEIFWKILELTSKHQDKKEVVKLRGKWVEVDPREWRNRFNMTVTVGLGTGNKNTELQGAMGVLQVQGGLLQAGFRRLVTEKNAYDAAVKYAKSVFPKDAKAFFTDPTTLPPPQPQPNPDMLKLQLQSEKMHMQDAQKKAQMAMQQWQEQQDKMFEVAKARFDAQAAERQAQIEIKAEAMREAMKAEALERQKLVESWQDIGKQVVAGEIEQQKMALQSHLDQVSERLQHEYSKVENMLSEVVKAQMTPKEVVKEGGRKIVRPVKSPQ